MFENFLRLIMETFVIFVLHVRVCIREYWIRHRPRDIQEQILEHVILLFTSIWALLRVLYIVGESVVKLFMKEEPKSVRNEIVLITGTGHGIGKQLALLYASEGATVVGWDVNSKNNEETMKEIKARGYPKPYSYVCDVSSRKNVFEVAEKVRRDVGEVTILINNAGIMPTHSLLEHTEEEIERIFAINVYAHFWTIQAILPSMKKRDHGHIVALSSCAGMLGLANLVPYCASKFAVRGLMESVHEELRSENSKVRITTIFPYMTNTGLCKNPNIKFKNFMKLLEPEEVARSIMHAQRTDKEEVALPGYIAHLTNFARMLPTKGAILLKDAFNAGLDSDLS